MILYRMPGFSKYSQKVSDQYPWTKANKDDPHSCICTVCNLSISLKSGIKYKYTVKLQEFIVLYCKISRKESQFVCKHNLSIIQRNILFQCNNPVCKNYFSKYPPQLCKLAQNPPQNFKITPLSTPLEGVKSGPPELFLKFGDYDSNLNMKIKNFSKLQMEYC